MGARFWGPLLAVKYALPHLAPTASITPTAGLYAHRQVGGEALPRRRAQRHHALLAALALDDEQALVALGGREAQADQLRDAQAAGVEQLDQEIGRASCRERGCQYV